MKIHCYRLLPDQDLKIQLLEILKKNQIQAGVILSAAGSLKSVALRFAQQKESTSLTGLFEILSLQGTLSLHGVHLHLSIADQMGHCLGGHLVQGCQILTTCELVILELEEIKFIREHDPQTGYKELIIQEQLSEKK